MRSKLAPEDAPSLQELNLMLDRALCDDPMELVHFRAADNSPHKFMQSVCD